MSATESFLLPRVSRRGDGTLVPALPQVIVGFPAIPGVAYNGRTTTGDICNASGQKIPLRAALHREGGHQTRWPVGGAISSTARTRWAEIDKNLDGYAALRPRRNSCRCVRALRLRHSSAAR